MSEAGAFQAEFSRALMAAAPSARPMGLDPAMAGRFAIYRNNVHRGLGDALIAAYPVVAKLVGEDFFRVMAQAFFRAEKARTGSLALYGAGFAEFIDGFDAAASVPYLSDIARLERARLEVLHEADEVVLDANSLAAFGDDLAACRFVAHSACRLVNSSFPIHAIWLRQQADQDGKEAAPVVQQTENILITRPGMTVRQIVLDDGGAVFARYLLDGMTVAEGYDAAIERDPQFDVTSAFAQLIAAGAFAGLRE
ncbi:HvfC/BufC N-terminal domain-containing protein [Thalassospira xiamenensis]|uniref:DNA-binding domain-containing protein n=1 Tax=Thalassospira xiamenensis TaxID=220697 RepID=A0A285R5E2_9PROT|nr:DNA-binding domain-containing protein [Thalassospira xiamenensis]SOB89320.1 Putative DNA-binding domain-containing protein [Thalassospira xiamenensis]